LSGEHHAGKGEVSSHQACDLGAADTEFLGTAQFGRNPLRQCGPLQGLFEW
jgi:hypothetical protein